MTTVKFYHDTRSQLKDGGYPLKIGVKHNKWFYLSLNIALKKEEWINSAIIKRKDAGKLNMFINRRMNESRDILFELAMNGRLREIDDAELKKILLRGQIGFPNFICRKS